MKWICTDPDTGQFRLDEGQDVWNDMVYTFNECGRQVMIDIRDYTDEEILSAIASFGYTGVPSANRYWVQGEGTDIDLSIIAECLFELEI